MTMTMMRRKRRKMRGLVQDVCDREHEMKEKEKEKEKDDMGMWSPDPTRKERALHFLQVRVSLMMTKKRMTRREQ